jgi:SAM-dependent methyltransferase
MKLGPLHVLKQSTFHRLHDGFRRTEERRAEGLRPALARQFLHGVGLEIGALGKPLRVPRSVRVTYVDRMDVPALREHYPELRSRPLVPVDAIDDGEKLARFNPGSQDFIIANHFLEHTQDPIGTVRRHLEVLKPGGVLFLGVPEKRWTFDRDRPTTSLEHLYRDHEQGAAWSYLDHIDEVGRLSLGLEGEELETYVARVQALDYNIHFHVWTRDTLQEMFADLRRRMSLPFEVAALCANRPQEENIAVLEKTGE